MFQLKQTCLLLDFLALKDFQRCTEDKDVFQTFNSGRLLAIFLLIPTPVTPGISSNLQLCSKKILTQVFFCY